MQPTATLSIGTRRAWWCAAQVAESPRMKPSGGSTQIGGESCNWSNDAAGRSARRICGVHRCWPQLLRCHAQRRPSTAKPRSTCARKSMIQLRDHRSRNEASQPGASPETGVCRSFGTAGGTHFVGEGGGKILIAEILQLPNNIRLLRKPEHRTSCALAHHRRHLESGWIQGKSCTLGLDEGLLEGPKQIEGCIPFALPQQPEFGPLIRTESRLRQSAEIPSGNTFLDVHTQPFTGCDRDQPMATAVTYVEADRGRFPGHQGKRLSMLQGSKGKLIVPAVQPTAQN